MPNKPIHSFEKYLATAPAITIDNKEVTHEEFLQMLKKRDPRALEAVNQILGQYDIYIPEIGARPKEI
jgi:hypothetical protein